MGQRYTLFVDESGEAGLTKVRTGLNGKGTSPFLALGAALIPASQAEKVRSALAEIASTFGKPSLHCNKLLHHQKVHYCREIRKQRIKLFSVLSYKGTLGGYREDIEANDKKYYNKCATYLLEKVGRFAKEVGIDREDLTISFEEANFNYNALRSYVTKCSETPINREATYLRNINPMSISTQKKSAESLLQVGDLAAHAVYKCADKSEGNFGIPEPRYLVELKDCFYGDKSTGRILGAGFKAIHHINSLKLDSDVRKVVMDLTAEVPKQARRGR